ncbi:MAG: hypothetical protein WBV31_06720 [Terriglobales bacterium]|jgi:hypothetical protein
MTAVIAFHILMLLLGLGIASAIIPLPLVSDALGYLHTTIGITTPPPQQVRKIAFIWIVSTVVIVDGGVFLLVLITRLLN